MIAGAEDKRPTFRFAPSPTGELHVGHALSALIGWHWAQRLGGRFLLRIEDIDTGRSRPQHISGIFEDLTWLGISWETPVLFQSQHFEWYQAQARRLQRMNLLYPCFATRKEIAEAAAVQAQRQADPDGADLYPGLHKTLSAREIELRQAQGQPFALRLDMVRAIKAARAINNDSDLTYTALDARGVAEEVIAQPERWGDVIIVRKDVPASYHLAVVCDDARQGVTHVTRGQDLEAATDLHRLLQVLLGLPAPLYHHHRLLLDADGRKLAKSEGAPSLASLRRAGMTRTELLETIGLNG